MSYYQKSAKSTKKDLSDEKTQFYAEEALSLVEGAKNVLNDAIECEEEDLDFRKKNIKRIKMAFEDAERLSEFIEGTLPSYDEDNKET